MAGGAWADNLKRAGYDGLVVEGASPHPVYLAIADGQARLRDASALWGQDALSVQDSIRAELKDGRVSVAAIGPAGERQVRLANIVSDEGRAAGRGGAGAVMGAKNLKAIAVRGDGAVPLAREAEFRALAEKLTSLLAGNAALAPFSRYGTANMLDTAWVWGQTPARNWRQPLDPERSIRLGGKRIAGMWLQPRLVCPRCPIRCSRWIRIENGPHALEGRGPEYGTLGALGGLCLNDDLEALCRANDLCNRYGLDTISTGAAVAFAMEAGERGALTRGDTGLDLSWGNVEATLQLIEQIGRAEGPGRLLGNGVRWAAAAIGGGSEAYAVHVKGMEVPPYDPRAFESMAVTYATSTRGACHMRGYALRYEQGRAVPDAGITHRQGRHDRNGKGLVAKVSQDLASVFNSLAVCAFAEPVLAPAHVARALSLATGVVYSSADVMRVGERITNLQRLFNLRCGVGSVEDRLPARLLEPLAEGPNAGLVPDLAHQLAEYYALRGWTEGGVPTPEKRAELGLEEAAVPA